jgi:hypothetical protein
VLDELLEALEVADPSPLYDAQHVSDLLGRDPRIVNIPGGSRAARARLPPLDRAQAAAQI